MTEQKLNINLNQNFLECIKEIFKADDVLLKKIIRSSSWFVQGFKNLTVEDFLTTATPKNPRIYNFEQDDYTRLCETLTRNGIDHTNPKFKFFSEFTPSLTP